MGHRSVPACKAMWCAVLILLGIVHESLAQLGDVSALINAEIQVGLIRNESAYVNLTEASYTVDFATWLTGPPTDASQLGGLVVQGVWQGHAVVLDLAAPLTPRFLTPHGAAEAASLARVTQDYTQLHIIARISDEEYHSVFYVQDGGTLTIRNVTSLGALGAAPFVRVEGASVLMTDVGLMHPSAPFGAVVLGMQATMTLERVDVSAATADFAGSVAYTVASNVTVVNSTFGAAPKTAILFAGTDNTLVLEGCVFAGGADSAVLITDTISNDTCLPSLAKTFHADDDGLCTSLCTIGYFLNDMESACEPCTACTYDILAPCGAHEDTMCSSCVIIAHGTIVSHDPCEYACFAGYWWNADAEACVACSTYDADAIIVSECNATHDVVISTCPLLENGDATTTEAPCMYVCDAGFWFDTAATACVGCSGCANGYDIVTQCSGQADTMCSACVHIENGYATTTEAPCMYDCDAGFWFDMAASACVMCSDCAAGYDVIDQCDGQADTVCSTCVHIENGYATTTEAPCMYVCNARFWFDVGNTACVMCSDCANGYDIVTQCSGQADTICSTCAPIENGHATTADSPCAYECTSGYYWDASSMVCEMCSGPCGAGEYIVTQCTATEDRVCDACDEVANAELVHHIDCLYECVDGFFAVNSTLCQACGTCGGNAAIAECSATDDVVCSSCPAVVGATLIDAATCSFACDDADAFYDAGTNACIACSVCTMSQVVASECGVATDTVCVCSLAVNEVVVDEATCETACVASAYRHVSGTCSVCTTCAAGFVANGGCSGMDDTRCECTSGCHPCDSGGCGDGTPIVWPLAGITVDATGQYESSFSGQWNDGQAGIRLGSDTWTSVEAAAEFDIEHFDFFMAAEVTLEDASLCQTILGIGLMSVRTETPGCFGVTVSGAFAYHDEVVSPGCVTLASGETHDIAVGRIREVVMLFVNGTLVHGAHVAWGFDLQGGLVPQASVGGDCAMSLTRVTWAKTTPATSLVQNFNWRAFSGTGPRLVESSCNNNQHFSATCSSSSTGIRYIVAGNQLGGNVQHVPQDFSSQRRDYPVDGFTTGVDGSGTLLGYQSGTTSCQHHSSSGEAIICDDNCPYDGYLCERCVTSGVLTG